MEFSLQASAINFKHHSFLVTLGDRTKHSDPRMTIWKLNVETQLFELHQQFYSEDPGYLTTITSQYGHFISVTYNYKMTTLDYGRIQIWR